MSKKCLVVILILMYCLNLFIPLLCLAQVVEGSSFYNFLNDVYNSSTVKEDYFETFKTVYSQMCDSVEFKDWMNVEEDYYYVYIPQRYKKVSGDVIGFTVIRALKPDIYIGYSPDSYQIRLKTYDDNYASIFSFSYYIKSNSYGTTIGPKTPESILDSTATFFKDTSTFPCSSLEEFCKLLMTNSSSVKLCKWSTTENSYIKTDEIILNKGIGLPEEEPPFDDSVIDWSSLFHYYVSTKGDVIPENRDIPVGEYNNKDYYMQNDLIFWWDGFEGMFSNYGNTDEDYMLNYLPNLQYTYIFTDVDGNTARLHSGWLGPLEYNTLHEQNLMFLADPNGDFSKVEPLYNILTAIVFNAKDFWIDTVIGDKTIQEFKDDNAIKDYINNKVESIWDEKGYLDFTLEVEVKVDKQDLTATDNIHTCVWYDTFNVYFNRDNDFTVQPDDSYYVFNSDDIDIVYNPDGTIDKIFINNENIESETLDNGDTVFRDKTTGDIIYTATKDNDGNPIVKDGNDNVVWQPDNSDGFDRVLDNLEASRF